VHEAIARPIVIEEREFFPSCSMGVALFPDHGADPDSLLRHADIAMHAVKEAGGNNWQTYAASMSERSLERLAIENDLRHALEREELLLHFQPQVDMRSGRVAGMEALLRWRHPRLDIVSPIRFVGLAEEMGLIVPIGTWILRTACRQSKVWQEAGLPALRVAVNMSPRQFYLDDIVARVQEALTETGLEPGCLEIELTESLLMTNIEQAVDTLAKLKAMGVRLAIDDFGTGYSSLSYLKRFPIDVLKIDQSFVRDVTINSQDATIVQSIISLAHSLRLQVIAEGVETEAQLAYLQRHGCDEMQGYYFSRPLSADAMTELLQEDRRLPVRQRDFRTKRPTLLIVDDDASVVAALRRLLRHEEYTILSASSGVEGLELLALHDVQVILSDHRMPGMTGAEFFAEVKIMYPDTMRVMLTGYTELKSVIDAINRGEIFRFITKPWENDVLIHNLREIFHHYRVLHAERVRMDNADNTGNGSERGAYLRA
jgi:EAL domain-containing protein (putative c-di-GMP-specific phosphodiesterase class I)/FixJ family two-component response regulator